MTSHAMVDGRLYHCGALVRRLRIEHRQAAALIGTDLHADLRATFEASYIRRAWLIDGRIGALLGVVGSTLSPYGHVWLGMTEEATHHRFTAVRLIRAELERFMENKWYLVTTVMGADATALRFAAFLGFHSSDPGLGSRAYDRNGRKRLIRHIEMSPDDRLPIGGGFLVQLGYGPMEAR